MDNVSVPLVSTKTTALKIKAFLVGTEEGFSYNLTTELRRRVETSITALTSYVDDLIERRKKELRDDIVSRLLQQREAAGVRPTVIFAH